jgi:hypothetical protein
MMAALIVISLLTLAGAFLRGLACLTCGQVRKSNEQPRSQKELHGIRGCEWW